LKTINSVKLKIFVLNSRQQRSKCWSGKQILCPLDLISSDSDISGISDDDRDEDYQPRERLLALPDSSSDSSIESGEESAGHGEGEGCTTPTPRVCSGFPDNSKETRINPEKKTWTWEKQDLPTKEFPETEVRRKNLDNVR